MFQPWGNNTRARFAPCRAGKRSTTVRTQASSALENVIVPETVGGNETEDTMNTTVLLAANPWVGLVMNPAGGNRIMDDAWADDHCLRLGGIQSSKYLRMCESLSSGGLLATPLGGEISTGIPWIDEGGNKSGMPRGTTQDCLCVRLAIRGMGVRGVTDGSQRSAVWQTAPSCARCPRFTVPGKAISHAGS